MVMTESSIVSLGSILPQIFIPHRDQPRLRQIADPLAKRGAWTGRFLLAELDRSIGCDDDELPKDTVVIGSRVTYRIDDEEQRKGLLVYPEDWIAGCGCISVLSPEGAALIGLRVGNAMQFRGPLGRDRTIRVMEVEPPHASNVVPFRRRERVLPGFNPRPEPDGAA